LADLAAVTAELTQLQAARLKILTGRMPEQVRTADGRFIVYGKADLGKIEARIAALEGQLAAPSGRPARGPLYVRFGGL
jgi:hypothetical protein